MRYLFLLFWWCPLPASAQSAIQHTDTCFQQAASKYSLDSRLLWSIAQMESRGRMSAVNLTHQSRTNTVDLGVMQINSSWLPKLKKYGITRDMLMSDRCLNIEVGAWILADLIARHGANWDAVGAYNTACKQLKGEKCEVSRMRYVRQVWRWYAGARPTSVSDLAAAAKPSTQVAGIQIIEEGGHEGND
jgi:soluble lytic murein transglycosylase-like protein